MKAVVLNPGKIVVGLSKCYCAMGDSTIVDLAAIGSGGGINSSLTDGIDIDAVPASDLIQAQGEENLSGTSSSTIPIALDDIDYWDFEVLRANNVVYNMSDKTHYSSSAFISGPYAFSLSNDIVTISDKLTNSTIKSVTIEEPAASAYSHLWHTNTIIDYEESTDTLYIPIYYVTSSDRAYTTIYKYRNIVKGTPNITTGPQVAKGSGSRVEPSISSCGAIYGRNNTHYHVLLFSPGSTDSSLQTYTYRGYNTTTGATGDSATNSKRNGALSANTLTEKSVTTSNYGISLLRGTLSDNRLSSSFVSGYSRSIYGDDSVAIAQCTYRNNQAYCIFRINSSSVSNSTVEFLCNVADVAKLGTFKRINDKVYTLLHNSRYAQIVQVKRIGSLTF